MLRDRLQTFGSFRWIIAGLIPAVLIAFVAGIRQWDRVLVVASSFALLWVMANLVRGAAQQAKQDAVWRKMMSLYALCGAAAIVIAIYWDALRPFAIIAGVGAAYLIGGLLILYLVVRVIRIAWKG